ncbi:MAG TPA: diiron oxygenase [Myxococcales bacterium]|jgi:hypothetical protein|nr:diiron oxygenase [Myxococcales bacterium]
MRMEPVERAAAVLSRTSAARFRDPYHCFDWPSRPEPDRLAMSRPLISLAAHPIWETLTDEQRWRAALLETAAFFSLNVAGERELMIGLAARLHHGTLAPASEYLLHFIQEECAHSAVFTRFCRIYAGRLYPDRQVRLPRKYLAGEEEFLFFAQVLVFEQLAGWHNAQNAHDAEVWALPRAIHEYHAEEEARHVAFGRTVVEALWNAHSPGWGEEGRAQVAGYLRRYLEALHRLYVSPFVYRDLGLADPMGLRAQVLALPARQQVQRDASARVLAFLGRLPGLVLA